MKNSIDQLQLSVVLPVYRNAAALEELVTRLTTSLQACTNSYEIIFVDDSCPENSIDTLKKIATKNPRVNVISFKENRGQHFALMVGINYARGLYTIIMDADLQDPPEIVPQLFSVITASNKFSAVYAKRQGYYESWPRLVTSYIFKRTLTLICGLPAKVGSFVIFDLQLKEKLLSFNVKKPYLTAMIICTNLPVTSIAIDRSSRPSGKSSYTTWGRLKMGVLAVSSIALLKLKGKVRSKELPHWQKNLPALEFYGSRFK